MFERAAIRRALNFGRRSHRHTIESHVAHDHDPAHAESGAYDFAEIQAKWLPVWDELEPFRAGVARAIRRPRKYILDMFPYPSGDLHMGHAEAFGYGDTVARYWRHQGFDVLHPVGWDSFGLPAENAAIKRGIDPRGWTYENIEQQKRSFRQYAPSFDWSPRAAHERPRVLQVEPVAVPEALREGHRLPQGRPGQLVPQRPDRARERAGHRRPLRALRRSSSRRRPSRSGTSGSPTTPTACSTT